MKVYIAGPISADPSRTYEQKVAAFEEAERIVQSHGHQSVSPLRLEPQCGLLPEVCVSRQQREAATQGQGKHSWECYMKADLIGLLGCDAIYPLRAWQLSPGARIEVELATAVGIPWYPRD